jgi:RHS repeat-associated protein
MTPGASPPMRPARIVGRDPAGNPVLDYAYSFDAAGNITAKATEHGTYGYDYDVLDRLIRAENPTLPDEEYSYDPVGNRLTDVKTAGSTWSYSPSDELQAYGAVALSYDANGSLIEKDDAGTVTKYVYDLENRLSEVRDGADALVARYAYDPFGRRLWKEVAGSRTYFFYAEEGLIAEADAGGTITRQYGWRPGGTWGTDPLYLKVGAQTYFYQNDHLGTPQKLVGVNGAVVWAARYEAFGAVNADVGQVENPLRFPGQYFDGETGLHYNFFRDYKPQAGRYITSDPIGLEGGINSYGYAGNGPLRYADPLGLLKITATFGGGLFSFGSGGTTETGFGLDMTGNMCLIVVRCNNESTIGPGFAALGGTVGAEKGNFCEGTDIGTSRVQIVDLGVGGVGALSLTIGEDGKPVGGGKAFGGVGAALGAGFLNCETHSFCRNLNPFR